jgi:hypothetical protein
LKKNSRQRIHEFPITPLMECLLPPRGGLNLKRRVIFPGVRGPYGERLGT